MLAATAVSVGVASVCHSYFLSLSHICNNVRQRLMTSQSTLKPKFLRVASSHLFTKIFPPEGNVNGCNVIMQICAIIVHIHGPIGRGLPIQVVTGLDVAYNFADRICVSTHHIRFVESSHTRCLPYIIAIGKCMQGDCFEQSTLVQYFRMCVIPRINV
jgi:hypothetical protein